MDVPTQYAIGAFIQALGQNPGLEAELRSLGTAAHVYMGTGLGCIQTISQNTRALDRAQRRWDRFWAERNPAFQEYGGNGGTGNGEPYVGMPPDPATVADPRTAMRRRPPGGTTGPAPRRSSTSTCASWPRSRG